MVPLIMKLKDTNCLTTNEGLSDNISRNSMYHFHWREKPLNRPNAHAYFLHKKKALFKLHYKNYMLIMIEGCDEK